MIRSPRYTSIVKHLVQCPGEVVHEIIGDLSIAKILDILTVHNNEYLEQCVSSHLVLGKIFPQGVLAEAKEYFFVYTRLAAMTLHNGSAKPEPGMLLLSFDGVQFRSKNGDVLLILRQHVLKRMEVYHEFVPVLQHYSPYPIPDAASWKTLDSAAKISQVFELLVEIEKLINTKKADQLARMARIVERYPGKVRTRMDFSQSPRQNSRHLTELLLIWRRDVLRRSCIARPRITAWSVFAAQDLYLVAYNCFLRAFLEVLRAFPSSKKPNYLQANLKLQCETGHATHDYPPEMDTVLEGMELFYPRDVEVKHMETRSRIESARYPVGKERSWSALIESKGPPSFSSSYNNHYKSWDPVTAYIPAADKDLDWLECFLHICDYMASMQLEMEPGQSVAAYWDRYTKDTSNHY